MNSILKLANALEDTKFRIVSQGDLLILKAISVKQNEDASASGIILAVTMAKSRMMALSQIGPILKQLHGIGLIASKEVSSSQTGRPMNVYRLTKKGERVLELAETLVHLVAKNNN